MKNGFAFAILGIAMTMVLVISGAFAGDEEIWGTYRLVTATNKYLDTGEERFWRASEGLHHIRKGRAYAGPDYV